MQLEKPEMQPRLSPSRPRAPGTPGCSPASSSCINLSTKCYYPSRRAASSSSSSSSSSSGPQPRWWEGERKEKSWLLDTARSRHGAGRGDSGSGRLGGPISHHLAADNVVQRSLAGGSCRMRCLRARPPLRRDGCSVQMSAEHEIPKSLPLAGCGSFLSACMTSVPAWGIMK